MGYTGLITGQDELPLFSHPGLLYQGAFTLRNMTLYTVQERNVNNMELREGYGNQPGDLKEKDVINVVHILVSSFVSALSISYLLFEQLPCTYSQCIFCTASALTTSRFKHFLREHTPWTKAAMSDLETKACFAVIHLMSQSATWSA